MTAAIAKPLPPGTLDVNPFANNKPADADDQVDAGQDPPPAVAPVNPIAAADPGVAAPTGRLTPDIVSDAVAHVQEIIRNATDDDDVGATVDITMQRIRIGRLDLAIMRIDNEKKALVKQRDLEVDRLDGLERDASAAEDRRNEPSPLFDGPHVRTGSVAGAAGTTNDAWRTTSIDVLGLTNRALNALRDKAKIETIGQLADAMTKVDSLTDLDGVGAKAAEDIESKLDKFWTDHPEHTRPASKPADDAGPAAEIDNPIVPTPPDVKKPKDIAMKKGDIEKSSTVAGQIVGNASTEKPVNVKTLVQVDNAFYVVTPPPMLWNQPENVYALRKLHEKTGDAHPFEGRSVPNDGDNFVGLLIENGGKTYAIGAQNEIILVKDGGAK